MDDVPSTPPRKKDGRRERTAKAISEAAAALFYERGVAATTIDEIAEQAGVSVGSVYVHFGSKDALYLALVDEASELNARYVAEAPPSESPLQRVFNAGEAYVNFAIDHPVEFSLISMQATQPSSNPALDPARERITARVEQRLVAIGADLAAAIEAGEITITSVPLAVKYLWATWSAVIGLTLRTDGLALSADEVRATLTLAQDALARGLHPDVVAAAPDGSAA